MPFAEHLLDRCQRVRPIIEHLGVSETQDPIASPDESIGSNAILHRIVPFVAVEFDHKPSINDEIDAIGPDRDLLGRMVTRLL